MSGCWQIFYLMVLGKLRLFVFIVHHSVAKNVLRFFIMILT